jgi:AcrR family transcriptional regulator
MARTRSERYPENQALILDTAGALFAKNGFPRTSISELAKACHCSKALLYHYYPSKEAILFALLDTHLERLRHITEKALAASAEPEAQFRMLVQASMTVYSEARDKHIVLMHDLPCLPPEQREEIRQMERELTALVADLLTRLNPALAGDPRLRMPYTMMFYGLLNWTYVWYNAQGSVGPEELADRAAQLFLYGFMTQAD